MQPRRPYRFAGEPVPVIAASPAPDSTPADRAWSGERVGPIAGSDAASELPLAGVRVADFTAFWAGPLAAQILSGLGAEVIHIEGPKRPDGIRMNTLRRLTDDRWWEWSPLFCGANTNKRDLPVDLSTSPGHEIAVRLLATCDLMIENFSPRVVEQLGLAPDDVLAVNPTLTVVRMPAFGLTGPWRDRVGFAQTIEQASGLAFLTGYEGESPVIPNGMCDPIAGVHAAFAALVALQQRDITGRGQVVEAAMLGGALNTAAEQIVEYSAYGRLLASAGNRSPFADQIVVRCDAEDEWVAITLADDTARAAVLEAAGVADLEQLGGWCACQAGCRHRAARRRPRHPRRTRHVGARDHVVPAADRAGVLRVRHPSGLRHPSRTCRSRPASLLARTDGIEMRRRRWAPTTRHCSASSATTPTRSDGYAPTV